MCKGSITHQVTYKREPDDSRSLLCGPVRLVTNNTPVIVQDDDDVDTYDPSVSLATLFHSDPSVVAQEPGTYQAHIYFSIDIPGLIPDVTAVEQFIGGEWVSLAFTREAVGLGVINDLLVVVMAIEVTDPAALTIAGVGAPTAGLSIPDTVAVLGIGTVTVAQIPQAGSDRGYVTWPGAFTTVPVPPGSPISNNVRGTTVPRRPFAGNLALQIDYDPEAINGTASSARYYKWFFRRAATTTSPATEWKQLTSDSRVYFRARYQDPGEAIDVGVYLPYSIGLDKQGFNRFRPSLAQLAAEQTDCVVNLLETWYPAATINPALVELTWPLTRLFDHASGYFPTSGREPGIYELKLSVYDGSRAPMSPGAGLTVRFPDAPVASGGAWLIPTTLAPAAQIDAGSDPGVFFAAYVDGTPCTGTIDAPESAAITASTACGLHRFSMPASASDVDIDYTPGQPNDHATYNFAVKRGHKERIGPYDSGQVNGGTKTWTLPLNEMIGTSCAEGAAFAADLVVSHTATDGRHNELRSLWRWDQRAFALVGNSP